MSREISQIEHSLYDLAKRKWQQCLMSSLCVSADYNSHNITDTHLFVLDQRTLTFLTFGFYSMTDTETHKVYDRITDLCIACLSALGLQFEGSTCSLSWNIYRRTWIEKKIRLEPFLSSSCSCSPVWNRTLLEKGFHFNQSLSNEHFYFLKNQVQF